MRIAIVSVVSLLVAGCVGDAPAFTTCSADQLDCAGRCIAPLSDWRNCGATDCGSAQGSGTRCDESSACLAGACVETQGAFVSPGNPQEGARVQLPRPIEFEVSFADPRRLLYTLDATEPRAGQAGTLEAESPLRVKLESGQSLRWAVEDTEGDHSFGFEAGPSTEAGQYTEKFAFAKSGSATVVASPGEMLTGSYVQDCWTASLIGDCPGCPLACGVALEGFAASALTCLVRYPGQSFGVQLPEKRQFFFTAPSQAGVYFVRASTKVFDGNCNGIDGTSGVAVGKVIVR